MLKKKVAAILPSTIILGVDPGGSHTGYGIIRIYGDGTDFVAAGRLSPKAGWDLPRRLAYIHKGLIDLSEAHKPAAVAVEDIFYGINVRSALKLGHVRGVVLLAAAQAGAEVYAYAPRLVKNAVAGYGAAEKTQVAHMVGELLHLGEQKLPIDASDALAVALCHAGHCRLNRFIPGSSSRGGRSSASSWRNLSAEDLAALSCRLAKK